MPNDQKEPDGTNASIDGKASEAELRKESAELKAKIAEAKLRNDMPLDSALGNPRWERNAADGHLDIPEDDGDEQ
jgi:hypothetical protein